MIGREPVMPYDRPPLSKDMLKGSMRAEELALECNADLGLTWRLGCSAASLDVASRTLTLEGGQPLAFDGPVIATGASPRRLPFDGLACMHVLRTRDDAERLKADLDRQPGRVVVIGGGFIGAEVASTCRALGIAVTVVEPLPGLLLRVLGQPVSALIDRIHSDNGVVPDTAWLQGCGLDISDGVLCDASCLAAPGIVAAGDVARWPNERLGECRRVEHWENAVQQGRHAARRLLVDAGATPQPYTPVPWVWSDQFGLKLQVYGSTVGHDEVRVVEPPAGDHKFVALYRRAGRLAGVAGIGKVRSVLSYRRLLEAGATWDTAISASST